MAISERLRHKRQYEREREAVLRARRDPALLAKHREAVRRYESNPANRTKIKARHALRTAVASGKVLRLPCERCANPKSHGHHHDYSKPLDVIWLCAKCHAAEHFDV